MPTHQIPRRRKHRHDPSHRQIAPTVGQAPKICNINAIALRPTQTHSRKRTAEALRARARGAKTRAGGEGSWKDAAQDMMRSEEEEKEKEDGFSGCGEEGHIGDGVAGALGTIYLVEEKGGGNSDSVVEAESWCL